MSLPLFMLIVFLVAVVAGAFGAWLGLGGGVFIVPALTLALGVNVRYAIGASIVSVIATSSGSAASYVRSRVTNMRLGMLLEVGTTLGAVVGSVVATQVPVAALFITFAVVLLYAAAVMLRPVQEHAHLAPADQRGVARWLGLGGAYHDEALGQTVEYGVAHPGLGLAASGVAGAVSGLLGVGGGIIKVPAMDLLMRVPIKAASATSSFMIGVTAATSAGVYFARGDVHPALAAPVAAGVLAGTRLGTRLLVRLRGGTTRRVFAVVLVFTAVQMLLRGLR